MRRILSVTALAAALALLGAGCGSGSGSLGSSVMHDPGAAPALHVPALFSIERRRGDAAIGDTLTVASDGSATIVRAGGGGGRRSERCELGTALFARLRSEAPQLPAPAPSRMHKVTNPSIYLLSRDGRHAVFMDGAIPPSLRRFVARVNRVLAGRAGHCANVSEQRP